MTPIIIALLILAIGAVVLIVAGIFTAKLLKKREDGLDRRAEALAEKEKPFSPDGAKRGPICLCTTKVKPGDGVLNNSIICFLKKENLESIPGFNGAARDRAGKLGIEFVSFISELWENGNRIKEANLYVFFTEDQHETEADDEET